MQRHEGRSMKIAVPLAFLSVEWYNQYEPIGYNHYVRICVELACQTRMIRGYRQIETIGGGPGFCFV